MRVTSKTAFLKHLDSLSLDRFSVLCVHSRLASFGVLQMGVHEIVGALIDRIGPRGSLISPAYTLSLGPNDVFDATQSPSQNMGVLAEAIRQRANGRTASPLHSHSYMGPAIRGLEATTAPVAPKVIYDLGPGSDFDALLSAGAGLLLLGCNPSEGATICHHLEAIAEVPYRAWLSLRRLVKSGGLVSEVEVRYFGRSREEVRNDFDGAWARASMERTLARIDGSRRTSQALPMTLIAETLLRRLDKDPWFLTGAH